MFLLKIYHREKNTSLPIISHDTKTYLSDIEEVRKSLHKESHKKVSQEGSLKYFKYKMFEEKIPLIDHNLVYIICIYKYIHANVF